MLKIEILKIEIFFRREASQGAERKIEMLKGGAADYLSQKRNDVIT